MKMFLVVIITIIVMPTVVYGDNASKEINYVKDVAMKYSDLHSRGAMWTEYGLDKINDLTLAEEDYVGVHGGKAIVIISNYSIGKIVVDGNNANVEICREIIGDIKYFEGFSTNRFQLKLKKRFKKEITKLYLIKLKKALFVHERKNRWQISTLSSPHVNWKNFIENINNIEDLKGANIKILVSEVTQAKNEYISTFKNRCTAE